jgi:epoxyqueuosine reductase QueG
MADTKELFAKIKFLCPHPAYEIGFATLAGLLPPEFAQYPYGISLARKMDDAVINAISRGPTSAYCDLFHAVNLELNKKTAGICALLKIHGIDALPIKATIEESKRDDNYRETLRYYFSHKMAATRAGIGWIGKTDLLITHRFGPRVRLATILMATAITEIGQPINDSKCGTCDICVKKCPPRAATGLLWNTGIDRNEFFNPFTCQEFCRKISAQNIQKEMTLCGICVSVCPQGKKKRTR